MASHIESAEAEPVARELAEVTGETVTEAVTRAVAEGLARSRRRDRGARRPALAEIRHRVRALPGLDAPPDEELMGYDDAGTFG